jgi:hypothetical protein
MSARWASSAAGCTFHFFADAAVFKVEEGVHFNACRASDPRTDDAG